MKLSDFDLRQLDEARMLRLQPEQKDRLLITLVSDLKEARERLNANSHTSSRPPSSDAPWSSVTESTSDAQANTADFPLEDDVIPTDGAPVTDDGQSTDEEPGTECVPPAATAKPKPKVGHQPGAAGHGRTLTLPVSSTHIHRPSHCAICDNPLDGETFLAHNGHYVLDIEIAPHCGLAGIQVGHEKHVYGEIACTCGHLNRSEPGRSANDPMWEKVSLSEWCLVGPLLASFIVCLTQRMRLSRRHTQEFLHDWLGIDLSTSTINHCIHEAGRAVEPLEEELILELKAATLVHADETTWKEWGQLLWLWVITSPTVCLFLVGKRSKQIMETVFEGQFLGWLMSDGYVVYREFKHRLRCWAHITRKANGLEEALNDEARAFGQQVNAFLNSLMDAVYQARESPQPTTSIKSSFVAGLEAFRQLCEQHRLSEHDKTKALAREFLNDWDAFWIVLEHPYLPLTNNEAERALRHWVIARLISQGTRTQQGTRAFALLASVIETCRKRRVLPWPYLARVIAERRKGNPAPALASLAA